MAIPGNSTAMPSGYQQALEQLPLIPRRETLGDGAEPQGKPQPLQLVRGQEPPETPTLETADDKTVFRAVDALVRSQDRLARNRWAIDLYHRALDDNFPFGRLVYNKTPNQAIWEFKQPPGRSVRENPAATPNKANDLCNKVVDMMEADPARPDAVPPVDATAADAAADIANEFLTQLWSPTGLNGQEHWRWSLRNALTATSSFTELEPTETGGGWQPYQILAHPQATDPAQPMTAPVATDPTTGQPVSSGPQGDAVDPILRYVSAENQFVEDPADADRVWLPGIRCHKLRREQVRVFPPTQRAEHAKAVILLKYCTLQEAVDTWETAQGMSPEQLAQLASFRTPYPYMIVPSAFLGGIADGVAGPALAEVGSLSPLMQRRMYWYRVYVADCPEYPHGLWLDVSGANGGTVLKRETLAYTVQMPKKGTDLRCRDIPVVQETPTPDIQGLDPMGWPFEARFAGSSEATATLIAGYLDALNQRLHPHVFLRSTTAVDDDDWMDRSRPILLNPTDQEPHYEQFPTLSDVIGPVEFLYQAQDSAASLGATATGLESTQAVSGVAKQITVQQARVGLSGIQQEHNGAKTRAWKICLQIAQAYFRTPQLLRFTGDEMTADAKWWTGEDLAGIEHIGLAPGTGTMMTPEGKAQYVAYAQAQQWMPADVAGSIALGGISRDLGLPPDPTEKAIEREIDAWLQGPPDGWLDAAKAQLAEQQQQQAATAQATQAYQQQLQAYQAQAQQAQATGQPVGPSPQAPQPPPPPPPLWSPFTPRPNDGLPDIAKVWMKQLSETMMQPEYAAADPLWRQLLDQRYTQAIQTVIMVQQAGVIGGALGAESYQQFLGKVGQRVMRDIARDIGQGVSGQMPSAATAPGRGQSQTGPSGATQPFVMGS